MEVVIHRDARFYLERAEPEESFEGVLREVPVRTGPDTRDLPLRLETTAGAYPVYAVGGQAERLRGLVGALVEVHGKRVDLRAEGHGVELWPATAVSRSG